jgi:hypothetical protein
MQKSLNDMKRKNGLLVLIIFFVSVILINVLGYDGVSGDGLATDKEVLGTLLPKDTESGYWKSSSAPEFFDPQNLWRYINGQAEMYLDYGFKLVVTSNYISMDKSISMTIEIYQMQSPHHAFGIYAAERSPDDNVIKMGVQGYLGGNVLNFWKGVYYVKLISFQTSPDTKEVLMKLADVIANKIKGSYSAPELFGYFPEKNKVKMSERLIPNKFLGQPFLKNGYRVDYKKGGRKYQVFLMENSSREEAEEAIVKYVNFLKLENKEISHTKKGDYQLFYTKGEKGKVIFQYGLFLGGVLDSENLSEAVGIIEEIVHKVKNRN